MKILAAMGIKVLRTYNTHYKQAANLLQAISELKAEDTNFEMYVMLGVWIDCQNAWTDTSPNHDAENEEANASEIQRAVDLANKHPDIVKIIAVGNEAMVKWAASYFVQPNVILKWVNHLQQLKKTGKLDKELWITSPSPKTAAKLRSTTLAKHERNTSSCFDDLAVLGRKQHLPW